jgi:methyl-accepting chemotaxis protein
VAPSAAPAKAPEQAEQAEPANPSSPKSSKKAKATPKRALPPHQAPANAPAAEAEPASAPAPQVLGGFGQLQGRRVLGELHERVAKALAETRDAQQSGVSQKLSDTARELVRFMMLLLALALASGVAIALLFAGMRKGVLRPLQALADGARRVSAERDLKVSVALSGDEEVQEVGRAFASMMETLRNITVEMRTATDRLLAASTELGGITRAQGDSISRQASALEETRRTSSTLRESSRSAAHQAESVLHLAQRAEELGRDGETAMTANLSSVEEIQGQNQQVVERIARLATSAQRIAAITGAVKDLADQSNVLALNAAIEASRAGEAGVGFGVVAREIRSLADRSIRATAEVRTVLAEVLTGIRDAAGLVEAASGGLAEGTASTRRLGDSVAGLTGIVRKNLDAVREIAGAVASQGSGIEQISSAVEDLSLMMDETLRSVNSTSQAAGMLREVSEQVSSAVKAFRL